MKECTISPAGINHYDVVWLGSNNEMRYFNNPGDTPPNSNTPTYNLGGTFISAPAIAMRPGGGCDMVGLGSDRAAYHKAWVNGTGWVPSETTFNSLGGTLLTPISILIPKSTRTDLFAIGSDHQLWRQYKNSTDTNWSGWKLEGGHFHSSVSVASRADGYYDVVGINALFEASYKLLDPTNSRSWESLGGKFKSQPVLVTCGTKRVDIFGLDINNKILHKYGVSSAAGGPLTWTPAGKDWTDLGGDFDSPPAAVSCDTGRVDVFALKTNGNIFWNTFSNGAWLSTSNWVDTKGYSANGAPAVNSKGTGKMDLYVQNSGTFWLKTFGNGSWGDWKTICGTVKQTAQNNGFPPPYITDWT